MFVLRRADALRLLGMWGLTSPEKGGEVMLPTGARLVHGDRGRHRWHLLGPASQPEVKATIMMLL